MVSRCLSAAGISFRGHPSPARDSAPLAIAYQHNRAGPRRVTTFRTCETRPERAPSLPRDLRCSRGPVIIPGPPPAALPRLGSYHPGTAVTHPGLPVTRHQSRVHVLRPPGLPLTRGPRMTREPSGFPPGSAPTRAGPAHARRGRDRLRAQARNNATSTTSCWPSNQRGSLATCATSCRTHRVAPAERPRRPLPRPRPRLARQAHRPQPQGPQRPAPARGPRLRRHHHPPGGRCLIREPATTA